MHDKPTFYELAGQLDALISLQAPAQKQIEEVIEFIADKALERYFFKHLANSENPAWFAPLSQRGFFGTPPAPIEHEGKVSYPRWPALWYLIVIAPRLPEAVVEVAGEIYTQNLVVFSNLVRAAQGMPPVYAARMVPLVLRWADEGMRIEEDVISLAIHLAKGNEWKAALALVDLILSPKEREIPEKSRQSPFFFPRAEAKAEKYFVASFVKRDLAFFLEQHPLEVLGIVQKNLEQALEIENRDAATDSSSGWRPAIEPHEQNWRFGEIKDLLVDAARQALDYTVESMPDQGRTRVEAYLKHSHSIFRRLAIYSIRVNATLWPDLVENLFVDERYLSENENYLVYHEYWMLMHKAYGLLSEVIQDNFVKRLLGKLPPDRLFLG